MVPQTLTGQIPSIYLLILSRSFSEHHRRYRYCPLVGTDNPWCQCPFCPFGASYFLSNNFKHFFIYTYIGRPCVLFHIDLTLTVAMVTENDRQNRLK